jgi:hypothetical protein
MKKTAILIALFIISISSVSAQHFVKGTNVISGLVGLGSSLGWYGNGTQSPALSVNFEHGLMDLGSSGVLSLGGYFGHKTFRYKGTGYTWSWNYNIIGVRGAYHYNAHNVDKLDLYGGLMISYNLLKYKEKYDNSTTPMTQTGNYKNRAGMTAFVGGRYFFTNSLAGNVELGYGVAYLNLGLSFKLGGSGK